MIGRSLCPVSWTSLTGSQRWVTVYKILSPSRRERSRLDRASTGSTGKTYLLHGLSRAFKLKHKTRKDEGRNQSCRGLLGSANQVDYTTSIAAPWATPCEIMPIYVGKGYIEWGKQSRRKIHHCDMSKILVIQKKLKGEDNEDEVLELLRNLDYMPLAISQAAAYIRQRAPRVTVSKYLKDFHRSEKDRASLLNNVVRDRRRDGKASNSILATWQISFEYIRSDQPHQSIY